MAILEYIGMLMAFISTFLVCFWWWNRKCLLIYWPVFGMFPALLNNIHRTHDYINSVLHQCGGTFLFKGPWFSGMDVLVTSDPVIVDYILTRNFANFQKGPEFKEIFEAFGDGIFNVDSDSWKFQRRMIHHLLKHERLRIGVERIMEEKVFKGLFSVLDDVSKKEREVDIQDIFQRLSFDSMCMLVLGHDPKSLAVEFLDQVSPLLSAFDAIGKAIFHRICLPISIWKLQRWLQFGEEKKMRKAWHAFDQFLAQCISSKRQELGRKIQNQVETQDGFNFLTSFLTEDYCEKGEDDTIMSLTKSDSFLRDMTFNLLLAGRDTVSAGLAWLFWLVATHPHVETKILQEIKQNLGDIDIDDKTPKLFSFHQLSNLVYLHAVICETLRLYPPVPFELKSPGESDVLPGNHQAPKRIKILFSLYTMGRREEIWGEDCLDFKPERWISETGRIKHVPYHKFIAFNAGPRRCIGKDLGLVEMKFVVAAILWNYSIHVVENHPVGPSLSLILYMKHGLKVRVCKRQATSIRNLL